MNNRVLEFMPPFTNGEKASIVIGQPTFTSSALAETRTGLKRPTGVAFDHRGNLWVADELSNRVLQFTLPFTNGERASIVIGQTSFTASGAHETRTGLDLPFGVAFDSRGNLWVVDFANNRVLEFTNTG